MVAEAVDEQNDDERARLAALAETLVAALRKEAEAGRPVSVDIGELNAAEVQLGRVAARTGTGFRAGKVGTSGIFHINEIETGKGNPG